jgi:regulator of sigma E protease
MAVVSVLLKILLALVVISVIVLIHEFGHFITAKRNGILVHEFALGMGPKLFGVQKGETLYAIRAFPIGGFVRMEGEDELSDDPRAFNKKTPLQRIAVVFMGPFMNLVLAFVVYFILINYNPIATVNKVGAFTKKSPAHEAGIKINDKFISVNAVKVSSADDVRFETAVNKGKTLNVVVSRAGQEKTFKFKPYRIGNKKDGYAYLMGIGFKAEKLSFVERVGYSFTKIGDEIKMTLRGFKYMITRKVSMKEVSGPIGMGKAVSDVAKSSGFLGILSITAFLSINLGVLNLLPIPALDGSRILFTFVELLRGKPVDQEKEAMVHFIGFVLLMLLMVVVMFNDVLKLFK